jgi:selenocysteine lyase/cysteine desulfurase
MSSDVIALRKQFPTLENWSHFDIARKAPLPKCVEEAMQTYMRDVWGQAGETAFSEREVERAREVMARLVGAPPQTLAFIRNTSEGLNLAAGGLGFQEGDKVLITDMEHSACVLPWRRLQERGVEVGVVQARDGRLPLESFTERMDPQTRAVAVSWVAYGNGYRTDIAALAEACRVRGIISVVDGIQAVGVLNTPLAELGADIVIAGGHKALLSHVGIGLIYCREDAIPKINPPYVARFSFATDNKWQDPLVLAADAHRFEYGNPNFLGIWVLRHSAEFIMSIGLEQIEERVRELTTYLYDRAEEKGFRITTPKPWKERAGIISFEMPNPEQIRRKLHERKIIVNVKDGRYLRTATHFYNTKEEIDRLVEELSNLSNPQVQ